MMMRVIVVTALLLLTACSEQMDGPYIRKAEAACLEHGGIHTLSYGVWKWNGAFCNDGTTIKASAMLDTEVQP